MLKFVVTMEYQDGTSSKITWPTWEATDHFLNCRLDCDRNAKEVKRVTICPTTEADDFGRIVKAMGSTEF